MLTSMCLHICDIYLLQSQPATTARRFLFFTSRSTSRLTVQREKR